MKRVKLSLNYKGLDHSGKVVFANNVYNATNGNSQLPNCAGFMPLLQTAITDLDAAIKAPNPSLVIIKAKEVRL